jgi:RIO kinase 1
LKGKSTVTQDLSSFDEIQRYEDEYEYYERMYDPLQTDRRARRKRKPRVKHIPKKAESEVVAELGDAVGLERGFKTTYNPGLYEEGWLLDSLRVFYDEALIADVLLQVKGGKEASVYLCEAHPTVGTAFLAAKVYRPRRFRNLSNDKLYRQGRDVLTADGRPVKKTDHRVMRAIGKKTAFGVQVSHTSWLMHEYKAIERLHQLGGTVPRPYATSENAILMEYVGDAQMAASTLNRIRLEPDEAEPLFREVMRNVELMLQCEMVHGDLSAYNILYWEGQITLIDFPQVVDTYRNREARRILERDVTRICEYFRRQGAEHDPVAITEELWNEYGEPDPYELVPDESFSVLLSPE